MKTKHLAWAISLCFVFFSCNQNAPEKQNETATETAGSVYEAGQSNVVDNVSAPDVVKVAAGSADHSTLVAAIQAASLVDALSNAGPFTVFAPTNAAFEKLPEGTVDNLLKPENKTALQDILQYHVWLGVLNTETMTDGQVLNMVNGSDVTVHIKDGVVLINEAKVTGSVRASNGIIHIVDGVLLPPSK